MSSDATPVGPALEDYKRFFDETPVALIRTDLETGVFIMANQFAAKLFGYDSTDELMASARTVDFHIGAARDRLIGALKAHGRVEDYELKLNLPHRTAWVSAWLRINCDGTCIEGSLIDTSKYADLREHCLASMQTVAAKLDDKLLEHDG